MKGLVARLVEVQEEARPRPSRWWRAVLYQVVDDEITAKALLQKGALKRRVTIIPLNKVSRGGLIDDKKAAAAGKVAKAATGGTAARAIEFVGFDEEVRAAMEYAFGDKFVCDSLQTARATANHKDVQKKCVTMDGDLVDPSGTMTGGSSGSPGSCLSKLTQLGEAQKGSARRRSARVAGQGLRVLAGAAKFAELSEAVELKTQEVALPGRLRARPSAPWRPAWPRPRRASPPPPPRPPRPKPRRRAPSWRRWRRRAGARRAEAKLKSMEGKVKGAKKDVKDAEAKAKAVEKKLKLEDGGRQAGGGGGERRRVRGGHRGGDRDAPRGRGVGRGAAAEKRSSTTRPRQRWTRPRRSCRRATPRRSSSPRSATGRPSS